MTILRQRDYRRVPWRNGAGETAEIAVAHGSDGEVDWRVSLAPMSHDGAFSFLPGLDRILTVVEGAGLELTIGSSPPVVLCDAPFAFAGDSPCTARLTAGPVLNLNVMTRRGRWRADVRRCGSPASAQGDYRLVFAVEGAVCGQAGGRRVRLDPRDSLLLAAHESADLALGGRWLDIHLLCEQ